MTAIVRIAILCGFLLLLVCMHAYSDPYEDILKDVDNDEEYLSLLNQLDTVVREPVNLLVADRDELSRLPWVSPWLAREIIALRNRGALQSLEDLEKIEGVDQRLVELLRPFVVVIPPAKSPAPLSASLRTRLVASPVADSYRQVKTYGLLHAVYSSYDAGILTEKDRDESRFNDFQTAFAGVRFSGGRVIVGDFVMVSGHGLVFSNPYGFSPSTVEPWRFSQGDFGIEPYTSVDENFAMHGAGLEYGGERSGFCVAVSQCRFDAHIDEDGAVTSLGTTGLHTGGSEDEDALQEDLIGLAFRTRMRGMGMGLSLSLARYNHDFEPARLDWLGETWKATGNGGLSFLGGSNMAFLEGALAAGGGGAVIAGFGYDRRALELLVLGRYYDERFLSLHARPFAFYSGLATGEKGLLTRLAFRPMGNVSVSIGNDLHERRPEEGGLASPSGSESFLDVEVEAGDLTFSMGEKLLMAQEPPAHEADPTQERTRLRSRLDVRYEGTALLDVRVRYENLAYAEDKGQERETSQSDLLRLDLAADLGRRTVFKVGLEVFTIGSYGARIYQYEPGLPYYPAIEMLKSDGSRWYSVLSLDMSPFGKLAVKYAATIYDADADRSQFMCYYALKI
jgi:hypothetical protein